MLSSSSSPSRISLSSSITRTRALVATVWRSSTSTASGIDRLPHRKLQMEARSPARPLKDFDHSIVLLHDSIRYRKTESGSLFRALGGKERVEDAMQILCRNAMDH